jgi:hypothetical protein
VLAVGVRGDAADEIARLRADNYAGI